MSAAGRGRRRSKHHEAEEHENHERWLVSYADMVTLLMCLFIVLFAISQVDKAKFAALASGLSLSFGAPVSVHEGASGQRSVLDGLPAPVNIEGAIGEQNPASNQAQVEAAAAQAAAQRAQRISGEAKTAYDQLAAVRDRIQKALVTAGYAGAAQYQIDERGLVVHIVADAVLFNTGKADLRPEGAKLLDALSPTLRQLPNRLRIEGHADSQPVDPRGPWPSNWELSAYRATTVLRHISAGGVPDARMSAAGYSATQPLVPDTDPAARQLNRRVDVLVLSTASPEANDLLAGLDAAAKKGKP